MGLDIYLYRSELPFSEIEPIEKEYSDFTAALWAAEDKPWDQYTEAEKDAIHDADKAKAEELGLGEYGQHPARVEINIPSPTHPDGMFTIGYFRSSYNEGGMESVLEAQGIGGLHYIFGNDGHEYEFIPDWEASLVRARESLVKTAALQVSGEVFGATFVDGFTNVDSQAQALEVFKAQWATHKPKGEPDPNGWDMTSYSCYDGNFWMRGFEVFGAISGRNILGTRGTWLIFKRDLQWYVDALEVVVETIQYVLDNPLPEGQFYYFNWSG